MVPAPAEKIEDRRTPELIIGVVGPIGSGATTTANLLERLLTEDYGYEVVYHRVRELIGESAPLIDMEYDTSSTGEKRVNALQDIGNKLRERFSPDYLARKCVERIALNRLNNKGYVDVNGNMIPLPLRRAHIIDSLKHPAELQLLRLVYGDVFWLVGIFAPEEKRRERLTARGIPREHLDALILRDENEDSPYGQKVRETFYNADFFIRNDQDNDLGILKALHRYADILLNVNVHTPNQHEAAMYTATSAAAKSACLSRQVGSAIYSKRGELLGVGWNDVPKPKGGLYSDENESADNRCYLWGGKICHNDDRKERLLEKIYESLLSSKLIDRKTVSYNKIKSALHQSGVRELLEFSRSIHAEMEAIISIARSGIPGLAEATLYTTTYPCHNCARHIVAAGISIVYFIEPYPKSLAIALHGDSISLNEKDKGNKTIFLQFEGVAPKNIIRLFKHGSIRKHAGKLLAQSRKSAVPVFQPMLDGFATYEQKIVKELELEERRPNQG